MQVQGQELRKHKWENRILIVKTSSSESKQYDYQLKEIEKFAPGFVERKLMLYQVTDGDYEMRDLGNKQHSKVGEFSDKLKHKIFKEEEIFEVILIGLDGGIKLRKTDFLSMKELFRIIDSMPMRMQEMRNKN